MVKVEQNPETTHTKALAIDRLAFDGRGKRAKRTGLAPEHTEGGSQTRPLLFTLFALFPRLSKGIGLSGGTEILVVHVGIDLSRVQVLVAQHLLESTHIHAVLQHQGGGGVAQLVGGVLGAVQPGSGQMLFHQLVDRRPGDPLAVARGDEQGVLIQQGQSGALGEPVVQRGAAGII